MAIGEAPVFETLVEINAASLARTELDPATLLLVRIAALAAVDAPPASYLMHVGPAVESGVPRPGCAACSSSCAARRSPRARSRTAPGRSS